MVIGSGTGGPVIFIVLAQFSVEPVWFSEIRRSVPAGSKPDSVP
jgi:hypothetical protein